MSIGSSWSSPLTLDCELLHHTQPLNTSGCWKAKSLPILRRVCTYAAWFKARLGLQTQRRGDAFHLYLVVKFGAFYVYALTGKEELFSSLNRNPCLVTESWRSVGAEGGEALCTIPLWLQLLWWPCCCKSKSRSFFSFVSSFQLSHTILTEGVLILPTVLLKALGSSESDAELPEKYRRKIPIFRSRCLDFIVKYYYYLIYLEMSSYSQHPFLS